jgi:anti-sigma factor RsiW
MTCREFIEFLAEYFSRKLSVDEHREFELHLDDCPECRAYLKSYEESIKLGKAAFINPNAPVPLHIPEKLVQAILAANFQKGS